jgi:hypothetical protein
VRKEQGDQTGTLQNDPSSDDGRALEPDADASVLPLTAESTGRVALAAVPVGAAVLLALRGGTIAAAAWLPAACLVAALLLPAALAGAARRPSPLALGGLAALLALAVWTAVSAAWAPVPALARDEGLLVLLYACTLALALLLLRDRRERLATVGVVTFVLLAVAVATHVRLAFGDAPDELYSFRRLRAPIGYWNAQAALFLLPFWTAVGLAAHRPLPVLLRAGALAGAGATLAGWLMTQSRGGAAALVLSVPIFFAVAPGRVRALVPLLACALPVVLSYGALTAPFRAGEDALEEAVRSSAGRALAITTALLLFGAAYALADRRMRVPSRVTRAAGAVALAALAVAVAGGGVAFARAVDEPRAWAADRWEQFKRQPETATGGSYLETIGSDRWDVWVVALGEFRQHPLRGIGGRGFAHAYMREGRAEDAPQRAHSLPLDALSETGVVGALLLALGLGLPLAVVARRSVRSLPEASVLAAAGYFLIHASADWTWTFPALGIPFFLLLGAGAAAGRGLLPRAPSFGVAAAAAAAVLLAFAPPWLAARYTERAAAGSRDAERELAWARALDPLSVEPHVVESNLAETPQEAIAPLEQAVEKQPEAVATRYLLARAYARAGREEDALRLLRPAREDAPRDPLVRQLLEELEGEREAEQDA